MQGMFSNFGRDLAIAALVILAVGVLIGWLL